MNCLTSEDATLRVDASRIAILPEQSEITSSSQLCLLFDRVAQRPGPPIETNASNSLRSHRFENLCHPAMVETGGWAGSMAGAGAAAAWAAPAGPLPAAAAAFVGGMIGGMGGSCAAKSLSTSDGATIKQMYDLRMANE